MRKSTNGRPPGTAWHASTGKSTTTAKKKGAGMVLPPPAPPSSKATQASPPQQITAIHCYRNSRPNGDDNTCGQAAVATILDFWGKDPWGLPRTKSGFPTHKKYWDDGAAIDAVKKRFPPDVVFGVFGTSGGQVRNALKAYGFAQARVEHTGLFSHGWEDRWKDLRRNVLLGRPVPVLVDVGRLGGGNFAGHWAIAYRIENGMVHLGAMNAPRNKVSEKRFLEAWQCPAYPLGYNH